MVERPHLFRISRCKTIFVIGHLESQAESRISCDRWTPSLSSMMEVLDKTTRRRQEPAQRAPPHWQDLITDVTVLSQKTSIELASSLLTCNDHQLLPLLIVICNPCVRNKATTEPHRNARIRKNITSNAGFLILLSARVSS